MSDHFSFNGAVELWADIISVASALVAIPVLAGREVCSESNRTGWWAGHKVVAAIQRKVSKAVLEAYRWKKSPRVHLQESHGVD